MWSNFVDATNNANITLARFCIGAWDGNCPTTVNSALPPKCDAKHFDELKAS